MRPEIMDQAPAPIPYGKHPPRGGRRILVVTLSLLALGYGGWYLLPPVSRAITDYRARAAARAVYEAAQAHLDPPDTIIYSERPADFLPTDMKKSYPTDSGATVPYILRGDPELHRAWVRERNTRAIFLGPIVPILYRHRHTSSNGATGVVTITFSSVEGKQLDFFAEVTASTDGWPYQVYSSFLAVEMGAQIPTGQVRFYAARPHPTDPTRFLIPFEIGESRQTIEGQLLPGPKRGTESAPCKVELRLAQDER